MTLTLSTPAARAILDPGEQALAEIIQEVSGGDSTVCLALACAVIAAAGDQDRGTISAPNDTAVRWTWRDGGLVVVVAFSPKEAAPWA